MSKQKASPLDSRKIGEMLKEIREEKGWTQAKLGRMLYVSETTVRMAEHTKGLRHIRTISAYAEALDCDAYLVLVPRARVEPSP